MSAGPSGPVTPPVVMTMVTMKASVPIRPLQPAHFKKDPACDRTAVAGADPIRGWVVSPTMFSSISVTVKLWGTSESVMCPEVYLTHQAKIGAGPVASGGEDPWPVC